MGSYCSKPTWETTKPYVPQVRYGYVIKVYDGDTITVASRMWGTYYRFSVRLRGIDCPEMKSDDKVIAMIAQKKVSDLILNKRVYLTEVSMDKYGRLLAKVSYHGVDVSAFLLGQKLAVPYDGGTKTIVLWKEYYK
jgi:micrococcal nuclease